MTPEICWRHKKERKSDEANDTRRCSRTLLIAIVHASYQLIARFIYQSGISDIVSMKHRVIDHAGLNDL